MHLLPFVHTKNLSVGGRCANAKSSREVQTNLRLKNGVFSGSEKPQQYRIFCRRKGFRKPKGGFVALCRGGGIKCRHAGYVHMYASMHCKIEFNILMQLPISITFYSKFVCFHSIRNSIPFVKLTESLLMVVDRTFQNDDSIEH